MLLNFTLSEESMNRILDRKLEELQGRSFRKALDDSLRRAKEKTKEKQPEIRPLLQTLIFDECVLPAIREMEPKAGTEAFEKAFLVNGEKVFAWKEKLEGLNGKLREWVPRTLADRGVEQDLGSICDTCGVDRPSLMPAEIAGDLIRVESIKPNKSFWIVCRVISHGFDVKVVRGMAKRLLRKRINKVIDEATGVNGEFAPRLANDIAVQLSDRIHENAGRIEMLIQDD